MLRRVLNAWGQECWLTSYIGCSFASPRGLNSSLYYTVALRPVWFEFYTCTWKNCSLLTHALLKTDEGRTQRLCFVLLEWPDSASSLRGSYCMRRHVRHMVSDAHSSRYMWVQECSAFTFWTLPGSVPDQWILLCTFSLMKMHLQPMLGRFVATVVGKGWWSSKLLYLIGW